MKRGKATTNRRVIDLNSQAKEELEALKKEAVNEQALAKEGLRLRYFLRWQICPQVISTRCQFHVYFDYPTMPDGRIRDIFFEFPYRHESDRGGSIWNGTVPKRFRYTADIDRCRLYNSDVPIASRCHYTQVWQANLKSTSARNKSGQRTLLFGRRLLDSLNAAKIRF